MTSYNLNDSIEDISCNTKIGSEISELHLSIQILFIHYGTWHKGIVVNEVYTFL